MNPPDDDCADMAIGDEFGNGGTGAVHGADTAPVTRFLTDLRTIGEGPAPEPSAELSALLAGATALRGAGRARPRHWRKVAVAAAAATLVGGSAAAATGRLPQPAQRFVSNMVDTLTPFSIPPDHVTPNPNPTPKAPVPPVEAPSRTSGDDSGNSRDDSGTGRDDGSGSDGRDGAAGGGAGAGAGSWSEGGGDDGSDDGHSSSVSASHSPTPSPSQSRQRERERGDGHAEHHNQKGADD